MKTFTIISGIGDIQNFIPKFFVQTRRYLKTNGDNLIKLGKKLCTLEKDMYSKIVANVAVNSLCRPHIEITPKYFKSQTGNTKLIAITEQHCVANQKSVSKITNNVKSSFPDNRHSRRQLNRGIAKLPSRTEQLISLEKCEYDVLVIGGGATGAGCALDATSRGLRTALVEANDFASGISSKSPKMLHGVHDLYTALKRKNVKQLRQVRATQQERAILMEIAPHLYHRLPVFVPAYNASQLIYSWGLLNTFDVVAGYSGTDSKSFMTPGRALETFPLLDETQLLGGFLYTDYQFDDARLCIAVALTAAEYGAKVCNYVEALRIDREENGNKSLVHVYDKVTGKQFPIKTRCIINATGVLSNYLRRMDHKSAAPITQTSSGTCITLPNTFCSNTYGLLDPFTHDESIVFMMPWQNHTVAGTAAEPCEVSDIAKPTNSEVNNILENLKESFKFTSSVNPSYVRSTWKGIRQDVLPEVDEQRTGTSAEYVIEISPNQMISIAGGPFSTYRTKAQDAIGLAIHYCNLQAPYKCSTQNIPLTGGEDWSPYFYLELVQIHEIPVDVARHLSCSYGKNAYFLLSVFDTKLDRLHPKFPFIEAEVHYACTYEYAQTLVDLIARRMRIAFLDVSATKEMVPRILSIMAQHFNWSERETDEQLVRTYDFLKAEMGMGIVSELPESDIDIKEEVATLH